MIEFIIFVVALILYIFIDELYIKNQKNKKFAISKKVKSTCKSISIPVKKIKILTNQYCETEEVSHLLDVKMIDALYDNSLNFIQKTKYASVLVYDDFSVKGKKYLLKSRSIELSDIEIMYKLKGKQELLVYIDSNNPEIHFFDLSFLVT